jgi:hypothetical protein
MPAAHLMPWWKSFNNNNLMANRKGKSTQTIRKVNNLPEPELVREEAFVQRLPVSP